MNNFNRWFMLINQILISWCLRVDKSFVIYDGLGASLLMDASTSDPALHFLKEYCESNRWSYTRGGLYPILWETGSKSHVRFADILLSCNIVSRMCLLHVESPKEQVTFSTTMHCWRSCERYVAKTIHVHMSFSTKII